MSWKATRYKKTTRFPHYRGRNRHHLVPKSLGGTASPDNMLLINIERHHYWHKMWGLRTLDEVIALLIRTKRAKEAQSNERVHATTAVSLHDTRVEYSATG